MPEVFDKTTVGEFTLNVATPRPDTVGRCPSTVRPVLPVLVFQLSKEIEPTRTTSSTKLGSPPNSTQTKQFPLEERDLIPEH